jgi:hypothetical protein
MDNERVSKAKTKINSTSRLSRLRRDVISESNDE